MSGYVCQFSGNIYRHSIICATSSSSMGSVFILKTARPTRLQAMRFSSVFHPQEIHPREIAEEESRLKKRRQNRKSGGKKSSRHHRVSHRVVDRARVCVSGGDGGKGSLSTLRLRRGYKLRPDGGNGGKGGDVVIVADPNTQALQWSQPHFSANSGSNGAGQDKHGRNGENLVLRVPCGVVVKRVIQNGEEWDAERKVVVVRNEPDLSDNGLDDLPAHDDETSVDPEEDFDGTIARNVVFLKDLDSPGSHILVARGGKGGLGSGLFSSVHSALPDTADLIKLATRGTGEVAFLELELKMIADVGLVGFPNAGKSSLLSAMSRASPEVAPYPFTTLHPMVGCIDYRDGFRIRMADIPGLLAGASHGRGKGHEFLRHIERTSTLVYIVDAAGVDGRDPVEDLEALFHEVGSYGDGRMLQRQALVLANKMDLVPDEMRHEIVSSLDKAIERAEVNNKTTTVLQVSAGITGEGLKNFSREIRSTVQNTEDT